MISVTRPSRSIRTMALGASWWARRPDALDVRDQLTDRRRNGRYTGADRPAVQLHGAGSAQRHATAELRAGAADDVAQHPEQRHVGGDIDRVGRAIDAQRDHGGAFSFKGG